MFDHYLEDSLKNTCMKGGYRFLEICSYSWGTVCFNSLEKLSLQWIQQGSPSEVLLWTLQENLISFLKHEVLYIKEERVVKVSVDNLYFSFGPLRSVEIF